MFWLHVCQKRDKISITLQIPSYRYLWLLEQCGLSGKTVELKNLVGAAYMQVRSINRNFQ